MLRLKPELPIFTSETRRFKPPTTTTAENPAISYFRPAITFKDNPEIFLNGLIKDVKKQLIPDKIIKTIENETQTQTQTAKLKQLIINPPKKEYDGTAQFIDLARQTLRFDLDYLGRVTSPQLRAGSKAPPRRPQTAPQELPSQKVEKSKTEIKEQEGQQKQTELIKTQESKAVASTLSSLEKLQIIQDAGGTKATKGRIELIDKLSSQGLTQQQITEQLKATIKPKIKPKEQIQITETSQGAVVQQTKGGQALRALKTPDVPQQQTIKPQPPPKKAGGGGAVLPKIKENPSNVSKK
jgi:hypothetical protein